MITIDWFWFMVIIGMKDGESHLMWDSPCHKPPMTGNGLWKICLPQTWGWFLEILWQTQDLGWVHQLWGFFGHMSNWCTPIQIGWSPRSLILTYFDLSCPERWKDKKIQKLHRKMSFYLLVFSSDFSFFSPAMGTGKDTYMFWWVLLHV